MKEILKVIQKSVAEVEIIYSSLDFIKKIGSYKAWIESGEYEIQWNEDIKTLSKEFENHQENKIKDMIKILLSEIESLSNSNNKIISYVGEYNRDEFGSIRKTLIFNNDSNYWKSIIESIWNELNKMGYDGFYSNYGEQYELKAFYHEEDNIYKWEVNKNE